MRRGVVTTEELRAIYRREYRRKQILETIYAGVAGAIFALALWIAYRGGI